MVDVGTFRLCIDRDDRAPGGGATLIFPVSLRTPPERRGSCPVRSFNFKSSERTRFGSGGLVSKTFNKNADRARRACAPSFYFSMNAPASARAA
jgi:hypothetical protein